MKTTNLVITVCAIILSLGLLYADEPASKGKDANIEDLMISKLNDDVQLTDSQIILIKEKAKTFMTKSKNVNSKATVKEDFEVKKQAFDEYEIFLNSILSEEQKERRAIRIQQRAENAAMTNKTNQSKQK